MILSVPNSRSLDDTVTYASETGVLEDEYEEAKARVPKAAPVVALAMITVPVGLVPFGTPLAETDKVTFCPCSMIVLVADSAADRLAFSIVTESPLDRLGAKLASPAYLANSWYAPTGNNPAATTPWPLVSVVSPAEIPPGLVLFEVSPTSPLGMPEAGAVAATDTFTFRAFP